VVQGQPDQQPLDPPELIPSPSWQESPCEVGASALGPGGPKLYKLESGGRLILPGAFEFMPYNETRLFIPADHAFISAAEVRRNALLAATSEATRNDALKALKKLYHARYKKSKERNEISLHVFVGPIKKNDAEGYFLSKTLPVCERELEIG
jgi:hypothetical protein